MVRVLRVIGTAAISCALLIAGTAVLASAEAIPGPGPVVGGGDAGARPGVVRATITFTKRPAHPWRSRIAWHAWKQRADGTWALVARDSWRAGSGLPGKYTTNPCVKGHGWLPDGSYTLHQYDDYSGTLIHGRAFGLSDKRCAKGTLRSDLFIHTESGAGNRQCADRPGDQLCRWEYPKINDYTSHGCIKMSPSAIRSLVRDYNRFFKTGVVYPKAKVHLVVR